MSSTRTFIMLKPSCVERGLVGEVISRFERKGFRISAMKMIVMSAKDAEHLYEVHKGKSFYDDLIKSIVGKRVVVIVIEGRDAVEVARKLIGSTDPAKAEPGTVRGDLGMDITDNIVHASDSAESYEREYRIFFSSDELS